MAIAPLLAILTALSLFVLVALPVILVLVSHRSSETAIFGWFVATLFFSWFAYVVFLAKTQKAENPHSNA